MILVLNCGSQSIKWKLFDSSLRVKKEGNVTVLDSKNYEKVLLSELSKVKKFDIKKVGHRVVHGGNIFKKPTIIGKNFKKLENLNPLAPLHNPFNVLGIKFSQSMFPKATHVAVFDTEFFFDLPIKASTYALPENIRKKYSIKRYGFHGISHEYVSREGAKILGKDFNTLKIISCHLGGGASVAAINKGKAIDTSMGFTPMEGVVMMTRSGSIDPGIIFYLSKKVKNVEQILNYQSGVFGLCGFADMRDVLKSGAQGNKKSKLAMEIFAYSVKKYIGSYFAVLGGCDLLVFTGAIGAGSAKIVNMICKDLDILKNTRVLSVNANEELAIAKKIK